jgi:AcrR family transcriptional regulator
MMGGKDEVGAAAPGSPDWWRARRRGDHLRNRRRRVHGITLERMAAATLRIIRDEGLDAVSMRRVAAELGTGSASLYRHVSSRDELLVVVADELLGTIPLVDAGGDWRQVIGRQAQAFREALLANPAIVELITRAQLLGPNALRARERALGFLLAAGFPPPLAVRTYLAVTHYVIGSVQLDNRSTKRMPAERAALVALFAELDPDTHPNVHAVADILGGLHPDDEFRFGLGALIDGVAAELARGA